MSTQSDGGGNILIVGHQVLSKWLDNLGADMIESVPLFPGHYDRRGMSGWKMRYGLGIYLAREAICELI